MAKSSDPFPLLTHADQLVEDLRRLVPKAVKQWDKDAIHHARVSTRRLKAVVQALKPVLSSDHRKSFNDTLRKLRRRLGPLRDIAVMVNHLDHLAVGRLKPAGEWLVEQLKTQRDEMREVASKKVVPPRILARLGTWWGVREELAECHRAVDTLLAESLHLQLDAFAERAGALVGDLPSDQGDGTAQDPHEVRIAGKALRYTLEMAVVEGHSLPAAVTRSFKQMQDALGLWHDYVVLAECAMRLSLGQKLPHHDAALQALVLDIAKVCVQRSTRQMARFSAVWTERGQELTHSIRESFPLTRPAAMPTSITEPAPASPHSKEDEDHPTAA